MVANKSRHNKKKHFWIFLISKIAADKEYSPTLKTIQKIMKAIKEVDPSAKADDFFDM